MAPVRTPGRKKRDADYSGIGRYGRKTGVTVPDLGPRDEFGLEPVDNLFSSPNKGGSTPTINGSSKDVDDMDLASSTQREPSDLIASVRQHARIPAKSRSPFKTSLGSSPRRSVTTFSSPNHKSGTPSEHSGRMLLARNSASTSLARQTSYGRAPEMKESNGAILSEQTMRPRSQKFDLMHDDSDENMADFETSDGEARILASDDDVNPAHPVGLATIQSGVVDGDESTRRDDTDMDLEAAKSKNEKRRERKRKSDDISLDNISLFNNKDAKPEETAKRGRPPKRSKPGRSLEVSSKASRLATSLANDRSPPAKDTSRKRDQKGTKPRTSRAHAEMISEMKNSVASVSMKAASSKAQRTTSSKQENSTGPLAQSPVVLRSGRRSVRPLAFWRGEQIVYEAPQRVGRDLLPGGYVGVDPGRLVNDIRPNQTRRRGRKKFLKTRDSAEDSGDEQERDAWEVGGDDPGVLRADVYVWDPDTQMRIEEAHEEIELALAPSALDDRTQWAKGRTFKFGKTLTLPFFHSGVVDLPPGGEKRPKNSRKNHMIFWVFSGRVRVDVSGNIFNVGRGGMWQVPRGNSYGLSNPFDRDVRIFFAQGSYMEQPEDEAELMAGATLAE